MSLSDWPPTFDRQTGRRFLNSYLEVGQDESALGLDCTWELLKTTNTKSTVNIAKKWTSSWYIMQGVVRWRNGQVSRPVALGSYYVQQ